MKKKTAPKKTKTPAVDWTARALKIAAARKKNAKAGISVRAQRAAAAKLRARKSGKKTAPAPAKKTASPKAIATAKKIIAAAVAPPKKGDLIAGLKPRPGKAAATAPDVLARAVQAIIDVGPDNTTAVKP